MANLTATGPPVQQTVLSAMTRLPARRLEARRSIDGTHVTQKPAPSPSITMHSSRLYAALGILG